MIAKAAEMILGPGDNKSHDANHREHSGGEGKARVTRFCDQKT